MRKPKYHWDYFAAQWTSKDEFVVACYAIGTITRVYGIGKMTRKDGQEQIHDVQVCSFEYLQNYFN